MKIKLKSFNIEDAKKKIIIKCINKNQGHSQKEIAIILGMSIRTLLRLLKEYKIDYRKLVAKAEKEKK